MSRSRPLSPEHRAALLAGWLGHKHTPETRAYLSTLATGRPGVRGPRSEEARANIATANKRRCGITLSVEQRRRLSEARKGHLVSSETRAKIVASNQGKRRTVETRQMVAAHHWSKTCSDAVRKKLRAAHAAGRWSSVETKRRQSEGAKRAWATGLHNVPVPNRYTGLAKRLHAHLEQTSGIALEPEVRFGRFTVDLYDRANHVAYEADCQYWHQKYEARRPGYHAERDKYLLDRFGLQVVHFDETQIQSITQSVAA